MSDWEALQADVYAVIERCRGLVPQPQLDDCVDLVYYSERAIAFENLCSHLYDFEAAVSPALLDELERVGKALKRDAHYWEGLRQPPPRPNLSRDPR